MIENESNELLEGGPFEQSLARLTPKNECDSLQLMFRAGIEQERRRTRKFQQVSLGAGVAALLLVGLCLSLIFSVQRLEVENRDVTAELQKVRRAAEKDSESLRPGSQDPSSDPFSDPEHSLLVHTTQAKVVDSIAENMNDVVAKMKSRVALTQELALEFQ